MASFRPASKTKSRLRAAFDGPAGSGKTFTALRGAMVIAASISGGRVAVINSESGAVEKYLGLNPDGIPFQFDVCELSDFSPTTYTAAILEAGRAGYAVLIIDSLSHAWEGVGGALDLVDKKKTTNANSFTAWKDVTPMHRRMIDAILRSPCHLIATMRTKTEYILEEQLSKSGKSIQVPKRVGMAPIQRQGMEYEFDVVGDLDLTHALTVSKTRCPTIDGMVIVKPGVEFFTPILEWLNEGVEAPAGFYTASEADLKALEDRRAKEERAATAKAKAAEPVVPIEQLMAQAAANGNGESSGGGVSSGEPEKVLSNSTGESQDSPAAAPPHPDDPATATTAQVDVIRGLFRSLKLEDSVARSKIAKRGGPMLKDLSWRNAEGLIAELNRDIAHFSGNGNGNGSPAPAAQPATYVQGKGVPPADDIPF